MNKIFVTFLQCYKYTLAQLNHQVFSDNLKAFENNGGWTQTVIKASHSTVLSTEVNVFI